MADKEEVKDKKEKRKEKSKKSVADRVKEKKHPSKSTDDSDKSKEGTPAPKKENEEDEGNVDKNPSPSIKIEKECAIDNFHIPKPKPLKISDADQASNWEQFKNEWDLYECASGLRDSSSVDRLITFLRVVGKDAINIYNSFSWPEETDARNIDKVIEKFESLCLSEKSTRFQRYLFYKREQETAENIDDYVSDIRKLAECCGFGDLTETFICDKIIFGLKEKSIKKEMLENEETDSTNIVKLFKEKDLEFQLQQKLKLEAQDRLSKKKKGFLTMAEEAEMIALDEEEVEELEEENGHDKDELILKADSDIEEIQEEESVEKEATDKSEGNGSDIAPTRRDTEFTSEDFKIEIRGLPRYYAMGQLKKLLNETLQLKAHKIKPAGNDKDWAYVTFRDEKARTRALAVLDDYKWKKCVLTSSVAKALPDPVRSKKSKGDDQLVNDPDSHLSINERVAKSVTPLALVDYEDQLKQKQKAALSAMRKFGNELAQTNPELQKFIKFNKLRRKGQVCEVLDIVRSPEIDGYRNKCEFTVGINPEDDLPTVGFRVSSYKEGSVAVGPVQHLVHIPESMKTVVRSFQEFVRDSEHKPFDPLTHEGVWRQLTVRTSSNDQILIAIVIHPQDFSEEQLETIKLNAVEFFRDGDGAPAGVTSIFFQAYGQKEPGEEDKQYEHVWGEEYITETVLGKRFRISCESFFQVNTKACEVLYETLAELADLDGTSVILDICCGTGTIGVSLADQCLKVYGIEMVKSAAADARHNAEENGMENVAIYTGKAEVNLNAVVAQCAKYNAIGVVDPPRAGLPESVIRTLRKCDSMNRMIYMSCDPEGAFKNFIDLSRPVSKNYKGEFFIPIKAVAVDMFPHTKHYELLILFERWEERKWRRIMEGNPLPRDQKFFDRIPAKPDGAVDLDSEDEEYSMDNTGMGSWKTAGGSRKGKKSRDQPYWNPRQERGGFGNPQSLLGKPQSLMGHNPWEDYQEGGYEEGGSQYDSYYNAEGPGMNTGNYGMGGDDYNQGYQGYQGYQDHQGFPRNQGYQGYQNNQGYQGGSSTNPYRLSREDYDVPLTGRFRNRGYGGNQHGSNSSYRDKYNFY